MVALAAGASTPHIALYEGKPITTSQDVAAYFGKRHRDVLRDIRRLIALLDTERQRNFALTFDHIDGPNGARRAEPAYRMTRDGFTLLAMGFTGQRALEFKLAYLDAFNRMEAQLRQSPAEIAAVKRFEETYRGGRFLAAIHDDGTVSLKPVADSCCAFDPRDEKQMFAMMDEVVPTELIPAMIQAGVARIARLANFKRSL